VSAPLAATTAGVIEAVAALADAAAALRPFGPWGGALVAAAGIAALTVGTRHARVLAVWGGTAVGVLAAFALHRPLQAGLGIAPSIATWVCALAGAAACGFIPKAFTFLAGALPGALVGAEILGGAVGPVAGALLGGIGGVAAGGLVTAAFASFTGGVLAALGLSAAFAPLAFAREIGARPFALAAVALVLGVAGTAFQARRGPPRRPEPPPLPPGPYEPHEWRGGTH
jgi:hypothetical protein